MKSVGLICEYNPFHNGHLHHLKEVKRMFPNYTIILIMSGSFMQRGEVSLLDKWSKTELALQYGINLVIELPHWFASQSADLFARGSIQLLHHLEVEAFLFGSESNDLDLLKKISLVNLSSDYNNLIKKYLKKGVSYPKACSKALKEMGIKEINSPNDLLAISYLKEINNLNSKIRPLSLKRVKEGIISASEIRRLLKEKEKVASYVPGITLTYLNKKLPFIDDYFPFLKYKILSEINNLQIYHTVDEGIENRIKKEIVLATSLEDLIFKIKTKRYTYNKIRRMLTHILCNVTKEEASSFKNIEYIRVLGFDNLGRQYLNKIKKRLTIPLVTNYSSFKHKMLELEFRATCVYASVLDEEKKKELIEKEYKNKPLIF